MAFVDYAVPAVMYTLFIGIYAVLLMDDALPKVAVVTKRVLRTTKFIVVFPVAVMRSMVVKGNNE
jgi:hypothetical protein